MWAGALKNGPSLTASGIERAARTSRTTSTYIASTSAPLIRVSVGM